MSSRPGRRPHQEEHEEHVNHERWLVSYADMMTLLMVLFIVLFAVSQVDAKKFDALHDGLSTAFKANQPVLQGGSGILDGGTVADHTHGGAQGAAAVAVSAPTTPISPPAVLADLRHKIQQEISQRGLTHDVSVGLDSRGVVIDIVTDRVLFDSGQSALREQGAKVIDDLAPALKSLPNLLVVEGHTDNVPLTGPTSNWELSAARATVVLRRLIADHISPRRVSEAGYADTEPKVANDTDAHRALNRRVTIVVLASTGSGAPAATAGTPGASPVLNPVNALGAGK